VVRTVHADPARAERLVQWARWFSADRADPASCAARLRSMNPVREGEREIREDPAQDEPQC
jgi:hypothetical protein